MENKKEDPIEKTFTDRTDQFQENPIPLSNEEDDNRTIVNMDVEGMPWHRKKKAVPTSSQSQMTPKETRQFILTATITGLLVALIFSALLILFVLFCTKVWFRV